MIPRLSRFDIIPSKGRNTSKCERLKKKQVVRLRNTGKNGKVRETNTVSVYPALSMSSGYSEEMMTKMNQLGTKYFTKSQRP